MITVIDSTDNCSISPSLAYKIFYAPPRIYMHNTHLKLHLSYKLIFLSRESDFQDKKCKKYRCLANTLTFDKLTPTQHIHWAP
jgi:hypothetical protein